MSLFPKFGDLGTVCPGVEKIIFWPKRGALVLVIFQKFGIFLIISKKISSKALSKKIWWLSKVSYLNKRLRVIRGICKSFEISSKIALIKCINENYLLWPWGLSLGFYHMVLCTKPLWTGLKSQPCTQSGKGAVEREEM